MRATCRTVIILHIRAIRCAQKRMRDRNKQIKNSFIACNLLGVTAAQGHVTRGSLCINTRHESAAQLRWHAVRRQSPTLRRPQTGGFLLRGGVPLTMHWWDGRRLCVTSVTAHPYRHLQNQLPSRTWNPLETGEPSWAVANRRDHG